MGQYDSKIHLSREGCRKAGILHCAHADTCGYAETIERPKLDSEGCLILKKI